MRHIDPPEGMTTGDIDTMPVRHMCDLAMHRLLCRDCNPNDEPAHFYLPVEVDGRDMLLTFTAILEPMDHESGSHKRAH